MFDPQTKERAGRKRRVLICDGFRSQETLEILQFCLEHHVLLCRLPSYTSHKLQPFDIGVFGPLRELDCGGQHRSSGDGGSLLYSAAMIQFLARDRELTVVSLCYV